MILQTAPTQICPASFGHRVDTAKKAFCFLIVNKIWYVVYSVKDFRSNCKLTQL